MLQEREGNFETPQGRREALLTAGRFGAYVAPAALALLISKKAFAVSSANCGRGNDQHDEAPPGGGFGGCGTSDDDAPPDSTPGGNVPGGPK